MKYKKPGYKWFFLISILTLVFVASNALANVDFFDVDGTEVSTSTLPNTEVVEENLELDVEPIVLDISAEEEVVEENIEVMTVSSSLSNTEVYVNLELPLKDNNLATLTAEEIIKKDVEKEQTEWIKSNHKYKQIKKEDTSGKYEVHEYKTSKGEIGYQTFIYDDQGRVIESIGEGVEVESRTWTKNYPTFTASTTL
jgi:hypothetical protein